MSRRYGDERMNGKYVRTTSRMCGSGDDDGTDGVENYNFFVAGFARVVSVSRGTVMEDNLVLSGVMGVKRVRMIPLMMKTAGGGKVDQPIESERKSKAFLLQFD